MLTRQKAVLGLLAQTGGSLNPTVFVKFMFLLRHETVLQGESSFYDFVPYRFGPFSFQLYRDLTSLKNNGYLQQDDGIVGVSDELKHEVDSKQSELPERIHQALRSVVKRYGGMEQKSLLRDVYERFPWFASRSELTDLRPDTVPNSVPAAKAVYTVGYEGKSVDFFFNGLLKAGVLQILDVRANPMSRKYGFARKSMSEISSKLGIRYKHMPALGIPGEYRKELSDFDSYQRLLNRYESEMLPKRSKEIEEASSEVQHTPTALLCMERDSRCCHRSRLANSVSLSSGLPIVHL